jgi:hypothetical protein
LDLGGEICINVLHFRWIVVFKMSKLTFASYCEVVNKKEIFFKIRKTRATTVCTDG